ncbi:hypothetical protein E4U14_003030 [Claviceps sp. LM454 group G7]|nr:hypothetical protein E4U14_003030 [Claviceps sp. LM454 group G7]
MKLSLVFGFGISAISATVLRQAGCDFKIRGSESQQGSLGQVSGAPTGVLQRDKNQIPESGFEIGCDGLVSFHGQSNFYQCATDNRITLVGDGCHADCPQPAQAQPSASAPVTKDCPANLDGVYEFPHLIIPVNKSNPDTAYGNSFFGEVTPSDIHVSDPDKTCRAIAAQDVSHPTPCMAMVRSTSSLLADSPATAPPGTTSQEKSPLAAQLSYGPGQSNSIASFPCPCSTTQTLSFELF